MDVLSITLQMILSLSILVILHECGHFFPAKWFKTRVEKFYLFFNPWFSLFKFQRGETEYGIGWIPFGGYVKISGMIDESMDKEQMKQPPQPWEFRSKPAWQRLIIMVGGVVVNFILGFFIFAMLLFAYGKTYYLNKDVVYGIAVDSIGLELGLKDGDKILKVGDYAFEKFEPMQVTREIVLHNASSITVERLGNVVEIPIPDGIAKSLTGAGAKGASLFEMRFPQEIKKVAKNSVAEKYGIQSGDKVLTVNGVEVPYWHEFNNQLRRYKDQMVNIKILRGADTISMDVQMDNTGKLGVYPKTWDEFFTVSREKFGFFESLPLGVKEGVGFLNDQLKAFGQMFRNKIDVKENLGSVISIARMFDSSWNWEKFWKITAMLSIILAFFNILPIPALDGGYVLFLLWEVITGRKPSDKFMEVVTIVGFVILVLLMIFVLGLDISKLFK